MDDPSPRPESGERGAIFLVPQERLLPALCPECGAAGSVPRAVPGGERLLVHVCDLCAAHAARHATLGFAWFTSAVVLSISIASAFTFVWGERARLVQFLCLVLIAFILGQLAQALSRSRAALLRSWSARLAPDRPSERLLLSHSRYLNRALRQLEFVELDRAPTGAAHTGSVPGGWSRLLPAVPLIAGCAWWLGLHGLARSSISVVNMGPGPVVLLVDDRRQVSIAPTRFEQPNLGYRQQLVAGLRKVSLLTASGEAIYSAETRLLPGQTLLIARLVPDACVWQERLDYEHPGSAPAWSLLARSTRAVLLEQPVDAWFTPLRDGSPPPTPETRLAPVAEAAFGTRLAVRLLPCPTP